MRILMILLVTISQMATVTFAQPHTRLVAGQILLDELAPSERKYTPYADSLDKVLMSKPNDTTALFYRALLYLQFNSFQARPDATASEPTARLVKAQKLAFRADSLHMHDLRLQVLCAQICSELTTRLAPMETWRFNAVQLAQRKQLYERYKRLANQYYDRLQQLDKANAYDYQKLKVQ